MSLLSDQLVITALYWWFHPVAHAVTSSCSHLKHLLSHRLASEHLTTVPIDGSTWELMRCLPLAASLFAVVWHLLSTVSRHKSHIVRKQLTRSCA